MIDEPSFDNLEIVDESELWPEGYHAESTNYEAPYYLLGPHSNDLVGIRDNNCIYWDWPDKDADHDQCLFCGTDTDERWVHEGLEFEPTGLPTPLSLALIEARKERKELQEETNRLLAEHLDRQRRPIQELIDSIRANTRWRGLL